MENRASDSGLEVVLDNRKLIVVFALLIGVCGCFFVLGFVEGKRQGSREVSRNAPVPADEREAKLPAVADKQGKKTKDEKSVKEQLDWYKSVSGRGAPTSQASTAAKITKEARPEAKSAAPAPLSQGAPGVPQASAKPYYTVQVGAFRVRKKAEEIAMGLKSKGYPSYIEASDSGVYFLRVGKFEARPEAIDMMHRLNRDGFPTMLKAH